MHRGLQLGRQYLSLKGIIGVLELIRTRKLKGYKVCTTRVVILESFLLDKTSYTVSSYFAITV
jgi:hypothetical protein